MTPRRVLVTGAAGFIGSHQCRRLVADGVEVVGLDDLSDGSLANLADVPEVRLIEADLRDEVAVLDAARGCDVVIHLGAKRSVPRSMEQPGVTTDVNVRGTLNVLLAARDDGALVVAASSSSVYGDQTEFPLHESMRLRPRSPYAASKVANEIYCEGLWASFRVPSVCLRYFNVYGPRQDPASEYAAVVPRFTMACLSGAPPVIHGDGEQSRDFTYIDDVTDANLRAASVSESAFGKAFNVGGGGDPVSVNRLLALIAAAVGVTPEPRVRATSSGGRSNNTGRRVRGAGRRSDTGPQWLSMKACDEPSPGSRRTHEGRSPGYGSCRLDHGRRAREPQAHGRGDGRFCRQGRDAATRGGALPRAGPRRPPRGRARERAPLVHYQRTRGGGRRQVAFICVGRPPDRPGRPQPRSRRGSGA